MEQHDIWTESEDRLLAELVSAAVVTDGGRFKRGEIERIAKFFPNRSKHSVEHRLSMRADVLPKREYIPWTEEEIVRLRILYSGTLWRLELKKNFPDRDSHAVIEKARSLGLQRKVLKTEAKQLYPEQCALMAGLLMADGSLSHRHAVTNRKIHLVSINFSNTDPALVELFASMASNCRVREYKVDPNRSFRPTKLTHYECDINSKEAVKHTLKQILPYMVGAKLIKAREMLLCLEGGHQT